MASRLRRPANNPWVNGTSRVVGNFFEFIARSLVGGELIRSPIGDLLFWYNDTGVGVEVKGADSRHDWLLRKKQLLDHYNALGFPIDHSVYVLFSYQNRVIPIVRKGRKKRTTELTLQKSRYQKEDFLATRTTTLNVISTEFLVKLLENRELTAAQVAPESVVEDDTSLWLRRSVFNKVFSEATASPNGYRPSSWILSHQFELPTQLDLFEESSSVDESGNSNRNYALTLHSRWLVTPELESLLFSHLSEREILLRRE